VKSKEERKSGGGKISAKIKENQKKAYRHQYVSKIMASAK